MENGSRRRIGHPVLVLLFEVSSYVVRILSLPHAPNYLDLAVKGGVTRRNGWVPFPFDSDLIWPDPTHA